MASKVHSVDDEAIATDALDMGTLLTENKALRDENKSLHDRLLRALAEAENVRRQADRTAMEARQYGIGEFARELLLTVDNLRRTVEAAERSPATGAENAALLEGVQATLRAFLQTLERFGVRPIVAQGKPFDPKFHEAIAMIDDPTQPPGTVTKVVEQGYTLRDRLLRPARVTVAKSSDQKSGEKPANTFAEPDDNDLGLLWNAHRIDP
jgi:molecular chaperone GrpE